MALQINNPVVQMQSIECCLHKSRLEIISANMETLRAYMIYLDARCSNRLYNCMWKKCSEPFRSGVKK